jgi:RecB family endonuclease NucS
MEVFNIKNGKVEIVESTPFKLERDIQNVIEKNTQSFFGLEFVRSEFSIGNYRIDTLSFDNETNSFVIIEYKKGDSYSVIDQGYTYLQLLLNNKSDFILTLSQHYNRVLRNEDIDWSQSKIMFISQSFNSYQKDSVNFKNLPFELWEIKKFSNDTVILNKHKSSSKESIDSLNSPNNERKNIIQTVNKEVQVIDEEFHLTKLDEETKQKWFELKDKLDELENIELEIKKPYISLNGENKKICYFNFRKNFISIEMLRGNVNPDGIKSKKYFNLDDPKGISVEGSWEWKSGTKGTIYKVKFDKNVNLDYIFFLIKQKYDSLK